MDYQLSRVRNIGISAHIDSGKTTLTERILYYCKKIHTIHEVRGKDGVGATMDSMELEKERGITIASAATYVNWNDYWVNIIDTPGHVDFTIEVENALRVLDGAILVLCGVGGVQSQTITVDRQLKRYGVPHIAFINKMDRSGANAYKVQEQLNEKLGKNAVLIQLPIGADDQFEGVIDLVLMKAAYFDGMKGDEVRYEEIPASLVEEAKNYREIMIDAVSMYCEELTESYLEGTVTEEQIRTAIRKGTISQKMVPVMMGTAYKNKGIQLLLDAVGYYLPAPDDIQNTAFDLDNKNNEIELSCDPQLPLVGLAFKLDNQVYGQLTYIRIYQGSLRKGMEIVNSRSGKRIKLGRLVRMHSSSMEDIDIAYAGDIVAMFGIDCALGDTFTSTDVSISCQSMFVPEPIISLAIKPKDKKSFDNMSKALNRFCKEDPTFKAYIDQESNETLIWGMGELHLDVYIERMRREYKVDIETGMPQVSYRETISQSVNFDYTHKKQTGGRGQYARICGTLRPSEEKDCVFTDDIKGGVIPGTYVPAIEKGFKACLEKGSLIGFPIVNIEMVINDGNFHPVDSSAIAFEVAAITAFRENYNKAKPLILEPIMKLAVETPSDYRSQVLASINQRRGMVLDTVIDEQFTRVEAEVPLSEIFGYATALRSLTQGKAEFSLEFSKYDKLPKQLEEKVIEEARKKNER